jgi:hypothetical protein
MSEKHYHRGCVIFQADGGWVWEDPEWGAESDDVFETVEDAEANINLYYSDLDN